MKNINAEDINLTLAKLETKYPRLDFSDIAYPSILSRLWEQIRILGLNFAQFINQIYQGIEEIEKAAEEKLSGRKLQFMGIKLEIGRRYFATHDPLRHFLHLNIQALLNLANKIEDFDSERFIKGITAHEMAHEVIGLSNVIGNDGDITPEDWLRRFSEGIELRYVEGLQFNTELLLKQFDALTAFEILNEIAGDKISTELAGEDYIYTQIVIFQETLADDSDKKIGINLVPAVALLIYFKENGLAELSEQLRNMIYEEYNLVLGEELESALRRYYRSIRFKTDGYEE